MKLFLSILYMIGLYGGYLAGWLHLRIQRAKFVSKQNQILSRAPYATLLVALSSAIPSLLQFFFPVLLHLFERDYARFLAGDWWRLVTPLFVQDGGIGGTVFNLVSLVLVGAVAEQFWDNQGWLMIFFGGGLLSQLIGFLWQPVGAGNSVANFSLAASLAVYCLIFNGSPTIRITAFLALGAGGILLLRKDIHGPAMLFGAVIALVLTRLGQHEFKE